MRLKGQASQSRLLPDQLDHPPAPKNLLMRYVVATALGDAFKLEPRGPIELKGKGAVQAHYLIGRRQSPAS